MRTIVQSYLHHCISHSEMTTLGVYTGCFPLFRRQFCKEFNKLAARFDQNRISLMNILADIIAFNRESAELLGIARLDAERYRAPLGGTGKVSPDR